MNLRDCIRPYTTLQMTNPVLMSIRIQVGIRIFNRWFGHSCGISSAIVSAEELRGEKNRMNNEQLFNGRGTRRAFEVPRSPDLHSWNKVASGSQRFGHDVQTWAPNRPAGYNTPSLFSNPSSSRFLKASSQIRTVPGVISY